MAKLPVRCNDAQAENLVMTNGPVVESAGD